MGSTPGSRDMLGPLWSAQDVGLILAGSLLLPPAGFFLKSFTGSRGSPLRAEERCQGALGPRINLKRWETLSCDKISICANVYSRTTDQKTLYSFHLLSCVKLLLVSNGKIHPENSHFKQFILKIA